ncbi:MAG: hypothetical protein ACYDAD_02015 [Acidimicrobiales bacterium]
MSAIEVAESALPHLQNAALELIAAARAFLDAAEEAVRDPAEVAEVLNGLAGLLGGSRVATAGRREAAAEASAEAGAETGPEAAEPGPDAARRPRGGARARKIERIQVS